MNLFNQRRQFFVCGFQYRLLAGNFIYLMVVILLFMGAMFVPLMMDLQNEALPGEQRDEAARLLLALNKRVWFSLPFVLLFCAAHSVLVSHRIAGPLYRFRQVFKTLAKGDFSGICRIRKKDYLSAESESINDMIGVVRERMKEVRISYRTVNATLPELIKSLRKNGDIDAAVTAGKMGSQLNTLGQQLGWFNVGKEEMSSLEIPIPALSHTDPDTDQQSPSDKTISVHS